VSEGQRRSARDRRRRTLGQNFLVDRAFVARFVERLDIDDGDLVVDVGAGVGALTLPLARAGAVVWAVEPDPHWGSTLAAEVDRLGLADRVRVIRTTFERLRLPDQSYRVVANPPFGGTTRLLSMLLDDPANGPTRADLVLEQAVTRKHAAVPPRALRTAAWLPWWEFEVGACVPRHAFRPRPSVDAAVLTITRRPTPLLPERLAPGYLETLRPAWIHPEAPPVTRPAT
jgi:23S rRNA (adenine-N6)-dimethyltransferase